MSIHRTRLAVAAIAAALLLTPIASVASAHDGRDVGTPAPLAPAGDEPSTATGGTVTGVPTGACTLTVAASQGGFSATDTVIVAFEAAHIGGGGWSQNAEVDAVILDVTFGQQYSFGAIPTDSEGDIFEPFSSDEGNEGVWVLTATDRVLPCVAEASFLILPLVDIVESQFLTHIKWLFVEGITSGCSPTTYCPDGLVTRGQMATFLVRALHLPPTSTDYFTDDESSTHEANINRLRAAGITAGCGGSNFCPDGLVTRGQMATFLVRALHLPATSVNWFTDDEGTVHEANINRLRSSNITSGCSNTTFCPNGLVTRGQMAAFLYRGLR